MKERTHTQNGGLTKAGALAHWASLNGHGNHELHPEPVPYRHTGSTYTQDGIRITGSQEFIDAVICRLTDLLKYEGPTTRLQVTYQPITDRETGQRTTSWSFYVQVHRRGGDAAHANLAYANKGRLIDGGVDYSRV